MSSGPSKATLSNQKCCVGQCSNRREIRDHCVNSTYLHIFPREDKFPVTYRAWLNFVRTYRQEFVSGKGKYVCSKHFKWDDYASSLMEYDYRLEKG